MAQLAAKAKRTAFEANAHAIRARGQGRRCVEHPPSNLIRTRDSCSEC